MSKSGFGRHNITMTDELWAIAERRAKELHFGDNVSAYLSHLVRVEAGVVGGGALGEIDDPEVERVAKKLLRDAIKKVGEK